LKEANAKKKEALDKKNNQIERKRK
jgi:hypothetical protein